MFHGQTFAISTALLQNEAGFEVEISAFPKAAEMRGKPTVRTVGAVPGGVRWGGSSRALKKAITDKCSKYGRMIRTLFSLTSRLAISIQKPVMRSWIYP